MLLPSSAEVSRIHHRACRLGCSPEENCCSWKGVECDNTTGHVITQSAQPILARFSAYLVLESSAKAYHIDLRKTISEGIA
ncbi:hypothetical protein HAX54_010556 [Datura stramonium]|uniref:Leucine-rich repeat-containing N-terminal plant-type domain-containing protein n=1 Tax=Datura stramonium TaxID=4076 RepID=A0ABS8WW00_DATST|nr:hypothetical protein [Datura stramonium]